jgi:hypothetical protein
MSLAVTTVLYIIIRNWELRQNINALSVGHEVTFTSEPVRLADVLLSEIVSV